MIDDKNAPMNALIDVIYNLNSKTSFFIQKKTAVLLCFVVLVAFLVHLKVRSMANLFCLLNNLKFF